MMKSSRFCLTNPVFLFSIVFFLSACSTAPTTESTPPASATLPPAASPTLAASSTAKLTNTPLPEITPTVPAPSPTAETRWREEVRLSQGVILCEPRFSPDGSRIAIPTSNGISIYETGGWSMIVELSNSEMGGRVPCALAFSPDGSLLAASYGNRIRFWQETGGELPEPLDLGGESDTYITSLDFSPDGMRLAAGYWRGGFGQDLEVFSTVLQTSDWQTIYTVTGEMPQFSPDSQRLATLSRSTEVNAFVYLYTADQGQVVHYWEGESVAFLPKDELLIESDESVRVMQTQDQTFGARLAFNGSAPAPSPDGLTAAIYQDGFVQVVDLADGKLIHSLALLGAEPALEAERLLFSPDGQHVTASFSTRSCETCEPSPGPIYLWENKEGAESVELPAPAAPAWMSFDPAGQELVVTVNEGVSRYNPASGASTGSLATFSDYIGELAVSPDGNVLAVGYNGTGYFGLRAWDLSTLSELRQYTSVPQGALSGDWWKMAFSPDGELVGMGGYFWQADSGELLPGWPPPSAPNEGEEPLTHPIGLAFAPDGEIVALGLPGGVVQLWQLDTISSTQTLLTDFPGDVISLAYSSDGILLAAAYAYTFDIYPSPFAQVWQMPAGSQQYRLPTTNIFFMTFSPDGQQLATLSARDETYQRDFPFGVVQLWTNTGELQTTLPPDRVVRLAFSPDGQTLALGLTDGRVQLWSLDGKLIQELDTSQAGVIAGLAFTPDGGRLIIASATGVIEIWSR